VVNAGGPALLSSADAVAMEAQRAGESTGSTTGGTGEGPESVDVVQEGVEREIESDQSVCASGIDQGPSEHDEEVPLTPPRHLTPLS
jgi:predicted ThiF/HesA family dinucleotide-utilizing enzyme